MNQTVCEYISILCVSIIFVKLDHTDLIVVLFIKIRVNLVISTLELFLIINILTFP